MGSSVSSSAASTDEGKSECPVSSRPVLTTGPAKEQSDEKCPVSTKYKNPFVYNVYSQKIDPSNQMPTDLNVTQDSSTTSLTPHRVKSMIPKGGTDSDTWLYPSPQMFYNALARKNKLEGVQEDDMNTVVAIHNNMNENTWRQILAWEMLRDEESNGPGREPKLLRFMGRPHDLSPKALLKNFFGCRKPFDRHDWIVDRGGKEVRYIIDYYHDESAVIDDRHPKSLLDSTSVKSIKVDVRPALDSFESIRDVFFRMPIKYFAGNAGAYSPPSFFQERHVKVAEDARRAQISDAWCKIQSNCESHKKQLELCTSEKDCGAASVKLQLCIGGIVCPAIVRDFKLCARVFESGQATEEDIAKSYVAVTTCLENFEIDSRGIVSK
jgi:cytochrome c heme-lyase